MLVDLGVDEEEEVGDPKEGEQDEGGSDRSLDLHRLSSVMFNFKSLLLLKFCPHVYLDA